MLSSRIHLDSTRCTGMFPNGVPTGFRLIPTHPLATLIPGDLPVALARLSVAAAIPTRHFLRHRIGGRVTSPAHAAATSVCGLSLSCLLSRPLPSTNPVFAAFPRVLYFFSQACYALPIGMSVEAGRLCSGTKPSLCARCEGCEGESRGTDWKRLPSKTAPWKS